MNLLRNLSNEKYQEFVEIRRELVNIRTEIRMVEQQINHVEPHAHDVLCEELNALKEKEHYLICCAKQLMGQRIWIDKTLREHRTEVEETEGTTVPV